MAMTAPSTYPLTINVVKYPHPALRKASSPVIAFDDRLKKFCQLLLNQMYTSKGVGLAAAQVAVNKRIFVTDHLSGEEDVSAPRVWINPRLENTSGETTYEEGCLSFPGMFAKVERFNEFDIVYQDINGNEQREHFDVDAGDFLGIVVQHELDHLDGIVFVDHLKPVQVGLLKRRLKDMEKIFKKETGTAGSVLRR